MKEEQELWMTLGMVAILSAFAGMVRLFQNVPRVTFRIAFVRAIVSASIGIGAWSLTYLFWPEAQIPEPARVAFSIFIATMGEQGLERLVQIWRGK